MFYHALLNKPILLRSQCVSEIFSQHKKEQMELLMLLFIHYLPIHYNTGGITVRGLYRICFFCLSTGFAKFTSAPNKPSSRPISNFSTAAKIFRNTSQYQHFIFLPNFIVVTFSTLYIRTYLVFILGVLYKYCIKF